MAKTKMRGFFLHNGGIPTRIDVDALLEHIGIPEVGSQIPYSRIAEIIKVDRKSGRWNSVIEAWKRELQKKHGITLNAIPNEGFDVLTDDGKTAKVIGYVRKAAKALKRGDTVAKHIDKTKLTNENRAAFEHYGKWRAAVELADATVAKQIEYPELDRAVSGNGAGN